MLMKGCVTQWLCAIDEKITTSCWNQTVESNLKQLAQQDRGLPLTIHFKIPWLFPDFPDIFTVFHILWQNDKKTIFILYFNDFNLSLQIWGLL